MAALLESGHPIYNPEHVYGRMEMNDSFSTKRKTKERTYWPDIHFSETDPNYQTLVEMTADVISLLRPSEIWWTSLLMKETRYRALSPSRVVLASGRPALAHSQHLI